MLTTSKLKRAILRPAPSASDLRRAAALIKQVSDYTRLFVLLLLGDGERSVGSLRSEILCSMTALSRHLTRLRLAGLVEPRRDAQRNVYDLTEAGWVLHGVVSGLID
jgi:DNA-binding transcriptional ArsR family regulator